MKKLSEYKNEEALDLLADIIEPVALIFADGEFAEKLQQSIILAVQHVIKFHKKSVLAILARLDGVPVEEYECTIFTLPMTLINILNDPDMLNFFASQGLKINAESFGSATENTEDERLTDSSNT